MDHVVSGAAFGAALTASGVFQPAVILGQLQFTNFQMIQTFLTATGTSAYAPPSPSPTSFLSHLLPPPTNTHPASS